MKKIAISFDYLTYPLWQADSLDDSFVNGTDIEAIKSSKKIAELADEVENKFSSYYEVNSHDLPIWFNEEQEKKEAGEMLALVLELKNELEKVNDGEFIVEDHESERLQKLIDKQ